MPSQQHIVLDPRGHLQYRSCPFPKDPAHVEHVRDAYQAAFPYLRGWCDSLKKDHGWHEKRYSLHQKSAICLQSYDGVKWSHLQIILPHHADVFFSEEYELHFRAMFADCRVKYDANDFLTPRISNAPQPLINIISLLQCALPGQIFFLACRDDGSPSHVNYYPTREWCLNNMAAVGAVTYKWLGLDPTNEIDWSVASHALGEYCSTRQTILVHDQDVDLDMFRWTAEPVLRMRDAFGQDRLLRTPQARPLRDETLYENDELDAPATPVLSSTSSSPSGYERSFSLPPSPSDDCVVSIPPSPCADYYDPRGADEDHQGGTSAEEDMEVATVPFDNMNDYRRNLASPATDGHAIATALGSLNHCSDIPTLQESKRYRSEVGKTLLPSDAWEAGLAGAVQRVRKSHGSRKQWEEMRWKTQDKGKAAPVQEVQYRQQVQASLLDRMERSAEVSPRLAERRYARGSPYQ